MKNGRTSALRLFVATLALSSAPIRAQTVSETDQAVALNTPAIAVIGKGASRGTILGSPLPLADFILRSSPIESDATMYLIRNKDNYDILTCRTPCLFKIPNQSTFSFNVATPSGYTQISKVTPLKWGMRDLKNVIKPGEMTFVFVPQ
jgi:hypothetical protein